ncbi:UDP-N-acetylmuramate--L-alanine ligase [Agrococcus casei]|uniref:UDP-N-acetylmuramate--L-alanine ligase n=1 Tax=Agrococcus casei TaxID=343512 RepID=UPI003F8DE76B
MIKPDLTAPIPEGIRSVHFIGIGGSGMSGIAHMMLSSGMTVSGSDRSDSDTLQELRAAGADVWVGHDGERLPDTDAVIVTSALWPDNPELLAARERAIPVLHRSQALHLLARDHRLVAVAGAHGKTTSTGMLVAALDALGADAGFVNGGVVAGLGTSSKHGDSDLFVLEADESDGSFLLYDVAVALITNVDADHLDHYGTEEAFDRAFADFADRASECVVISSDDPGALRVREQISHENVMTFGWAADADVRLLSIEAGQQVEFTLEHRGEVHQGSVGVVGEHNGVNAAGAVAVLVSLGFEPKAAIEALRTFAGTGRRFESHGTVRGVDVYDDYAHHPVEVEAALKGARTATSGRIIAVHQPHLFTRTRDMADEFAEVYERLADHTVVLDVYGAREDPIEGVTGALVADAFADASKRDFIADWQQASDRVAEIAEEGDLVMTLSCGNVNLIIPQLKASLAETEDD